MRPAIPHIVDVPSTAPEAIIASNPYGALTDPGFISGARPVPLTQSFTLQASLEPIEPAPFVGPAEPKNEIPTPTSAVPQLDESTPLPIPRPPELRFLERDNPPPAYRRRFAQEGRKPVPPTPLPDNRSFFEKLFGIGQSSGPVLANAAPQSGAPVNTRTIGSSPAPNYDRWTAVYDVAAHTVYLPNGTRLEAHSGLGNRIDDPRYVNEKMRGATPPNVYELQPREQLFHGVQALRLIPVGNGDLYGRNGLLAHTYMLGPNGDSNGCVSFKNYNAFLQAYQNGEIKRLVVVARVN